VILNPLIMMRHRYRSAGCCSPPDQLLEAIASYLFAYGYGYTGAVFLARLPHFRAAANAMERQPATLGSWFSRPFANDGAGVILLRLANSSSA
jgi:hypothetical protein